MQPIKPAAITLWVLGGLLVLGGLIRGLAPISLDDYTSCGRGFTPGPGNTLFDVTEDCAAISTGPLLATWALLSLGLLIIALALHAAAGAGRTFSG
ncbi:hypothetical protein ACLFMI_14770 [Pseudonocardia nantongensis]|uniref:hypothetical protein n=1 Tax=Pseudonocardia nantongensis TaxID=1181885 RepID=UPI00397C4380